MARLTAHELSRAKQQRAAERKAQQEAEEVAEREAKEQAVERREWLKQGRRRSSDLANVLDGLYDELRELNKKWPTHTVTQRTLDRVNKAFATARDVLKDEDDEFLDALAEIVSAGDLPETRDVVMALREAKDAVERFRGRYLREWIELDEEDEGEDHYYS